MRPAAVVPRTRVAVLALWTTALVLAPRLAEACYVCGAASNEKSRFAFAAMTGFMTVLPFLLVGSLLWWLRRRLRARDAEALSRNPRARLGSIRATTRGL